MKLPIYNFKRISVPILSQFWAFLFAFQQCHSFYKKRVFSLGLFLVAISALLGERSVESVVVQKPRSDSLHTCQVIPSNIHLWKTVLCRRWRKVPKLVKLITLICKVPAFTNVHLVSVMTMNKTAVSGLTELSVIVG